MSCRQNYQMLFNAVSWVVKVEQVYLPLSVKTMLPTICFPSIVLASFLILIFIAVELWTFFFSGAGIDLSSLVVIEGKICWDLYIDGLVVSSDGNLLDALGAAIKVQFKTKME